MFGLLGIPPLERYDQVGEQSRALLTSVVQSRYSLPKDSDPDQRADPSTVDNLYEDIVKNNRPRLYQGTNDILFGSRKLNVDLSELHPKHVHIFRLWQIYLDNLDPLLKVTFTPSLQARIVDAAGDIKGIQPELQALMFSIYSVSVSSISDNECHSLFGAPKEEVLNGYRFATQQGLLHCDFLCSSDRDCLTALYLYLVA